MNEHAQINSPEVERSIENYIPRKGEIIGAGLASALLVGVLGDIDAALVPMLTIGASMTLGLAGLQRWVKLKYSNMVQRSLNYPLNTVNSQSFAPQSEVVNEQASLRLNFLCNYFFNNTFPETHTYRVGDEDEIMHFRCEQTSMGKYLYTAEHFARRNINERSIELYVVIPMRSDNGEFKYTRAVIDGITCKLNCQTGIWKPSKLGDLFIANIENRHFGIANGQISIADYIDLIRARRGYDTDQNSVQLQSSQLNICATSRGEVDLNVIEMYQDLYIQLIAGMTNTDGLNPQATALAWAENLNTES